MLKKGISILVILVFSMTVRAQDSIPGWKLIWSDEFNGKGLPDPLKWSYDTGGQGWGNHELEYYTADRKKNARMEKGMLVIEARKEKYKGMKYTSARLVTKGKADWTYGRIEVRAKLPRGLGTWPAISTRLALTAS